VTAARRGDGSAGDANYGRIAQGYAQYRQPEPAVAAEIGRALSDARTILNVGAGAESYEPTDRAVTAGEFPYPGGNIYGATRAFVRHFSLNLRADLFGTRVRVTDIEPGVVAGTEFSDVRFKGNDAAAAKPHDTGLPMV